jgi:ornithine cyclodeaminase/alanine dehydrogenase-like protein (mu-crystallin family)
MTLLLNRSTTAQLLPMDKALAVVEKAFAELEEGSADLPLREIILLPGKQADCFFMPGYLPRLQSFGIKIRPLSPATPRCVTFPLRSRLWC